MSLDHKQALERYNKRFEAPKYNAVTRGLLADLDTHRDDERFLSAANLVANTALSLCGHASYAADWLKLAAFCGQSVSLATIEAIHAHLRVFEEFPDTRADDFATIAKALWHLHQASDPLLEAVRHANDAHGWHGRAAYQLLAAADLLTQSARILIAQGHTSYATEKLEAALSRLRDGLEEGAAHHPRHFRWQIKEGRDEQE
ncbi:MAG: hypothetical protein ACFB51_13025 [Anaerolineae bacterium]